MIQIGILTPRSKVYSSINFDFLDGLKCGLAVLGVKDIEIKTAGINFGSNDKEVYAACETLVYAGCDIVVGYLNAMSAAAVQSLFINAGTLFIHLDSGYHFPLPDYKQENIFTLSLDGTLACRILPAIAAKKGDSSFAFTCSFYDSGYRSAFGFFNGVFEAESTVIFNHVTKLHRAEFSIEPLTKFLKNDENTSVMIASCGDMTVDFFGNMEGEEVYTNHSLYGSPFVAEETWLAQSPYPNNNVIALVPWASSLDNEENKVFVEQLKKRNRKANYFSLLSWEAAIVIAKALEADNTTDRIALLEGYSFNSPRGVVTLDKNTHSSHSAMYETTIVENEVDGMCKLIVNGAVDQTLVQHNRERLNYEIKHLEGTVTSWLNTYGCIE